MFSSRSFTVASLIFKYLIHFELIFVLVQLLSPVPLFVTPWTVACQASCPSSTPGAYSDSCPSSQ